MRIKTLKRNTSNVLRRLAETRQARVSQINLNLNVLLRQKKDVQRHLDGLRAAGSVSSDSDAPLLSEMVVYGSPLGAANALARRSAKSSAI